MKRLTITLGALAALALIATFAGALAATWATTHNHQWEATAWISAMGTLVLGATAAIWETL